MHKSFVAVVLALVGTAGTARAAAGAMTSFTLKREQLPSSFLEAQSRWLELRRSPVAVRGARSANVLVGELPVGARGAARVLLALDESKGTGKGYDTLVADGNRNKDLSDDPRHPIRARGLLARLFGGQEQTICEHVKVMVPYRKAELAYQVGVIIGPQEDAQVNVWVCPDMWAVGEVALGGRRYSIGILDANVNGVFGECARLRETAWGSHELVQGDRIHIAPSGKPALDRADAGNPARSPLLSRLVKIDGQYHELAVNDEGTRAAIRPVNPRMGKLRLPAGELKAHAASEHVVVDLSSRDSRVLTLPVGEYAVPEYDYTWRAGGKTIRVRARTYGSDTPAFLVLKPDTTTDLQLGQPLHGKMTADRKNKDTVSFSLTVFGPGGERIRGVYINGKRPPAPRLTVRDSSGKKVLDDKFSYG